MEKTAGKPEWILLIHQLPPQPTNLRVRIWRKLNQLGAVAIKNSVYVLPFSEKTHEDFQWLKKEIEAADGEATVFRANSVEGTTDQELIGVFRRERDEEYLKLAAQFDALRQAIKEQKQNGKIITERGGSYETEFEKLNAELYRIIAADFFSAPNHKVAVSAYRHAHKELRSMVENSSKLASTAPIDPKFLSRADYQRKHWITRRNMHIDRLASAWLIKRFIDGRPRFSFVAENEKIQGGIHFDMFEAEFTHVGEDCTFETLLNRFGLAENPALREIAEIVHDIDLKDTKFNRLEAVGLDVTVRGLSKMLNDDRKLLGQCTVIFDGLYEQFFEPQKAKERVSGKKAQKTESDKNG